MNPRRLLPWLALLLVSNAVAATYSLPSALGSGVFSSCSSTTTICTGTIDFGNDNGVVLNVTTPMTLLLSNGNFQAKNNLAINNNGHAFTLQLNNGNFSVENNFTGSVNIVAGNGNVEIGNNGVVNGNITAGGNIQLGNNTRVNGVCNKIPSGGGTCSGAAAPALPIADWRLDEAAWNGTAGEVKDSGIAAKHGRAVNGASTAAGKLCQGGSFDGTRNRYVSLPADVQNLPGLLADNFTMALWVSPGKFHEIDSQSSNATTGVSGQNYALYPSLNTAVWNWDTGGYAGAGISAGLNGISVYEHAGAYMPPVLVWPGAVSRLAWTHVAVVYSAGVPSLYVNGAFKQTGVAGTHPNHLNVLPTHVIGSPVYGNYQGGVDEYKIFSSALSAAQIAAGYTNENAGKNWDGSTRVCGAVAGTAPAALNAVDVGANAVSGQITTKSAGAAFSLDIYALNAARTAQDTAASGAVLVDLLANTTTGVALGANNCPASGTTLSVGTVTLAAGKATASVGGIANAWRDVRARMRYPATGAATVTACSADNFAVKPAVLTAIASHADWQTAGTTTTLANTGAAGGVVHKAGQPFTLRVSGYNAGNAVTSNYDGSPAAATACVLPASGCVAGSLGAGSFSAASGTLTSNTASYSEVGAISATFTDTAYAGVDSDDSAASCAGFHVCAGALSIGRFVPDHFDITSNTPAFAPACASFTYLGQPFGFGAGLAASPTWTITARNSTGSTTRNYSGSLFKLAAATVTGQAWSAASGTVTAVGTLPVVSVSDLGTGSGSLGFSVGDPASGGGLVFARAATVAPFDASLTLAASVADSEGVTHAGNPFQHSGIAFDDGNAGTTNDAQMRLGRLRLGNAVGSELLPLPVPLTAQFWNGQGYVSNSADNCTAISSPTLTFFSQTADNQLAGGETTGSFNATLVAGNGNLWFTAPGAGHYGFMDVGITAPAWLKFNRDGVDQGINGNPDGDLLDDDPRARATFGKRRGSDKVIIRRELY
ncbi:MAG: LamG-like jellyroll fold domain-containing protein [Pseudomonadota bacterium]|nr:LamG-like jellyroll fold domain-containing protein [Pseudomonadota bacterium]